jgi:hypothetical protein
MTTISIGDPSAVAGAPCASSFSLLVEVSWAYYDRWQSYLPLLGRTKQDEDGDGEGVNDGYDGYDGNDGIDGIDGIDGEQWHAMGTTEKPSSPVLYSTSPSKMTCTVCTVCRCKERSIEPDAVYANEKLHARHISLSVFSSSQSGSLLCTCLKLPGNTHDQRSDTRKCTLILKEIGNFLCLTTSDSLVSTLLPPSLLSSLVALLHCPSHLLPASPSQDK